MKLVLASKNQKKLKEMNEILSQLGIEVCSEADAGVDVEVEDIGVEDQQQAVQVVVGLDMFIRFFLNTPSFRVPMKKMDLL